MRKNSTPRASSSANSNAAIAILLFGAAIVSPAMAQTAVDPGKPTPGAALRYVGGDTRIGIGIDSELDARGELYQVLQSSDTSATLGELWAARHAGGLKLSHQWANGDKTAVTKVFIAADQGENAVRKLTLGGGQEYQNWFWNSYLSKGISGERLVLRNTGTTTSTVTGTEGGRGFVQDINTTLVGSLFERPFDLGVGVRAGHFYEGALLRLTAGLDYDWGKKRGATYACNTVTVVGSTTPLEACPRSSAYSNNQTTLSLTAEKYFEGSGFSVAVTGEALRRSGLPGIDRNDTRGLLMLRYELGAPTSNFRPSKITRTVTTTERVPDPNWVAPAAEPVAATGAAAASGIAAPASSGEPQFRTEKSTSRANTNDAQETYFDLGSAALKPAAMKELDALVARIAAQQPYVELKVVVVGHTCPTGSDRNNFPLSQKRADAVKAYLISKGIAANLITTDAKAGKAPKYPEVKGQSFRNRRADTDVTIVKEKSEDVRVPVAATPVAATPPNIPSTPGTAPPATAPMIDRPVSREVVEDAPNPWLARALRNSVPHNTRVDTYSYATFARTSTLGDKRFTNAGPVAVNDSFRVACGSVATFAVLANDTDVDGDTLTITSVSAPSKGTAVISGRSIVYTPAAGACSGSDSFTYTISDGKGGTSTATVSVTVDASAATNTAPVAVNDRYVVGCKIATSLDVLNNDSDKDGDSLTITSVTQPTRGSTISIATNGKGLTYTPGGSCFWQDTFTYTVSDGKGGTATATVTLVDP
jgi:outer membrane protein OmpA-like peptidoglycan-associated protein